MNDIYAEFIALLIVCFLSLLPVILIILFIGVLIVLVVYLCKSVQFKNSGYTTQPVKYYDLRRDVGEYGEYLTFYELKFFEKSGAKLLHNCYLPKSNGETTEIDLLMIHTSGIYVIESKNYSGWIFGNENQNYWVQSLRSGRSSLRKEKFYNPIMQNRGHIRWLEKQIGTINNIYSLIVFSERCTLKSIEVNSSNVWVIKRNTLKSKITSILIENQNVLSPQEVEEIYNKLVVFTNVSQEVKDKHIQNIKRAQREAEAVNIESISTVPIINEIKYKSSSNTIGKSDFSMVKQENISNDPLNIKNDKFVMTNNDLKCPKCGGFLRRKTYKKGPDVGKQYYLCSNNPECDYEKRL